MCFAYIVVSFGPTQTPKLAVQLFHETTQTNLFISDSVETSCGSFEGHHIWNMSPRRISFFSLYSSVFSTPHVLFASIQLFLFPLQAVSSIVELFIFLVHCYLAQYSFSPFYLSFCRTDPFFYYYFLSRCLNFVPKQYLFPLLF